MSHNIILPLREIPCIFFLFHLFILHVCISVYIPLHTYGSQRRTWGVGSPLPGGSLGLKLNQTRTQAPPYPLASLSALTPCVFYDPWHLSQESQTASTATTGFCLFACLLLVLLGLNLEAKGSTAELQPQLFIPTLDVRP